MSTEAEIEPPECPVCLQPYSSAAATVPRVISCGHSACESCLSLLPQPFPHTIRCPSCTVLVKLTNPSSLPKNIDLLRFSSSLFQNQNPLLKSPENQNPQCQIPPNPTRNEYPLDQNPERLKKVGSLTSQDHQFIPGLWSQDFFLTWKKWVVAENDVVLEESGNGDGFSSVLRGRRLLECGSEKVSLVRIGGLFCVDGDDTKLRYSYVAKVMWVLNRMKDEERDELGLLLRVSSLKKSRVCKLYGVWYNCDDQGFYLVSERYMNNLSGKITSLRNGFGSNELLGLASCGVVAVEICEAISVLHSNRVIAGCFDIKCFCFDEFGHVYIDLNETLVSNRRFSTLVKEGIAYDEGNVRRWEISLSNDAQETLAFVSPEVLFETLKKNGIYIQSEREVEIGYCSDVWSVACVLLSILIGEQFVELIRSYLHINASIPGACEVSDFVGLYRDWTYEVMNVLEHIFTSEFEFLRDFLRDCLSLDPGDRPLVIDLWKCLRKLFIKPEFDIVTDLSQSDKIEEKKVVCLFLGELCKFGEETNKLSETHLTSGLRGEDESGKADDIHSGKVSRDLVDGLSVGHIRCIHLKAHLDCITGLTVGGGFLFSSSFDKTIRVWSLQDFAHVQTFKGHEHKVMAVVYVDKEQPLCISGDSGGGIYIWDASFPFAQEPRRKLYEQKDWRYSGIHCLAVSGSEYLYTGSGDKSIKAWSLQEYNVSCVMNGHKSVVSTLAVCGGVLYSGSWDGTVRLWCLSDHSPLAVLGEDAPGNVTSVLSLAAYQQAVVVAHENGSIKVWRNNMLLKFAQAQKGPIFSVCMEDKWLFTGGLDKVITVQELLGDELQAEAISLGSIACDSVVTALLYWQGKLFVGQADRVIKVYYYGS